MRGRHSGWRELPVVDRTVGAAPVRGLVGDIQRVLARGLFVDIDTESRRIRGKDIAVFYTPVVRGDVHHPVGGWAVFEYCAVGNGEAEV